jgi:aminoglycoside phosphotransferase
MPREVKLDVAVSATHLNEEGRRMALASKIVITPRPGGFTVDVDWACMASARAAAVPVVQPAAAEQPADDVQSLHEAQQWLSERMPSWRGTP